MSSRVIETFCCSQKRCSVIFGCWTPLVLQSDCWLVAPLQLLYSQFLVAQSTETISGSSLEAAWVATSNFDVHKLATRSERLLFWYKTTLLIVVFYNSLCKRKAWLAPLNNAIQVSLLIFIHTNKLIYTFYWEARFGQSTSNCLLSDYSLISNSKNFFSSWIIRMGNYDLSSGKDDPNTVLMNIGSSQSHPEFDKKASYFDVAILTVKPVPSRNVKLPFFNLMYPLRMNDLQSWHFFRDSDCSAKF